MTKRDSMIKEINKIEYAVAVMPTSTGVILHPFDLEYKKIYTYNKKGLDENYSRVIYINEIQRWMDFKLFYEIEIGLN